MPRSIFHQSVLKFLFGFLAVSLQLLDYDWLVLTDCEAAVMRLQTQDCQDVIGRLWLRGCSQETERVWLQHQTVAMGLKSRDFQAAVMRLRLWDSMALTMRLQAAAVELLSQGCGCIVALTPGSHSTLRRTAPLRPWCEWRHRLTKAQNGRGLCSASSVNPALQDWLWGWEGGAARLELLIQHWQHLD